MIIHTMENFKKQYRDLETRVFNELRNRIENSTYISKHTNTKAIKIDLFDYTELTVINHDLTFLDRKGYHYSIFGDCTLEDLIDILNED